MPRKPLIRSNTLPYHVTARGNNKEIFPCDLHDTWAIFSKQLAVISEEFNAKIHAFVMMPNHFHLLITTPNEDLGVVMNKFMSSITRSMNSISGRSGRVFGSRYHRSLVSTDVYFDCALKYIYRNPVKAKKVLRVEEYEFSSLKIVFGWQRGFFKLSSPTWNPELIPNQNSIAFLEWLNKPFKSEDEIAIQKGLRRLNFSPPNIGWKEKPTDLSHLKLLR